MLGSLPTLKVQRAARSSRSRRRPASASPRSVDLAGQAVTLSADIPILFDGPLAAHHQLIGRWVAAQEPREDHIPRSQARLRIERVFSDAVASALDGIDLAELRVVVLRGDEDRPPALVIVCDSIGQIDLGWIETSDAPTSWRAAAYRALEESLGCALPIFGYQDLFEEISLFYWDGETDDEPARRSLIAYHGADEDDLDEMSLPSTMNARRPDWMLEGKAAASPPLPAALRKSLREFRDARRTLRKIAPVRSAWQVDMQAAYEYWPCIEEAARLPPMTLVPLEQFAREIDDVARHGMELGFMDLAGLCPLDDPGHLDGWFVSLRVGADLLRAAQALINLDPSTL